MEPVTINLPIYLEWGVKKKTKFALNLNVYRNTHFQILNKAKVIFDEMVGPKLKALAPMTKVDLTYRLFFGSNRSVDVSNVCCIVDKFFSDTLVGSGKLVDDNRRVIGKVAYEWGGVDRGDPRVEVELSIIEDNQENQEPMKRPNMQVILNQAEIENAVRARVFGQIAIRDDQEVAVELKATRGEEGYTAVVSITQKEGPVQAPKVEPVKTAEAPKVESQAPKVTAAAPKAPAAPAPKETQKATAAPAAEPAKAAQTPPVIATGKSLFPAAMTKPKEAAAPAPATSGGGGNGASPKMLFAGLTKPVHDPKPEATAH